MPMLPTTICLRGKWRLLTLSLVGLAMSARLLQPPASHAGGPAPAWMSRPQTDGYNEPHAAILPPVKVTQPPVRYSITITVLAPKNTTHPAASEEAHIMAHLPEGAPLWIAHEPTLQQGTERHFSTPPLTPGKKYTYVARVVWYENGKWVSQNQKVPVWAGRTTCIFLSKPSAVTTALNELRPEDRKLAIEQKYCPIQPTNLLGAMGKPVKVMLKGQPVFLCCEGCEKQARAKPDQTRAKVRELKTKAAAESKK